MDTAFLDFYLRFYSFRSQLNPPGLSSCTILSYSFTSLVSNIHSLEEEKIIQFKIYLLHLYSVLFLHESRSF